MQINGVLLLLAVGAVAVLAKKGSSEEKNGYNVVSVWPYPRPAGPGLALGKHKFKHPKHQAQIYFVPAPEYQQAYLPQAPQVPQGPYVPQRPEIPQQPQGVSISQTREFLFHVQKQMQDFSVKAYKEFQSAENEIDRNRAKVEEVLKSQFQSLELAIEAKGEKEVQQAVKDGKDEKKINDCLAKEEQDFRQQVDADIARTRNCLNDATERGRKVVSEARNSFTETSVMNAMQVKDWAQKMNYCAEKGDVRCIQEGAALINEKTKSTVHEGTQQIGKLQEGPRQQMIQMAYCSENFVEDMKEMREMYSKVVKRCVLASEIQTPEESNESESSEEEKKKVEAEVEAEVKEE